MASNTVKYPDFDLPAPLAPAPTPADCGTNLLADGEEWLMGQLQAHASVPITYRRGSSEITLCATLDTTLLNLADDQGGVRIIWTDRDFIVPVEDLYIDGQYTLPQRDDEIDQQVGAAIHTFKVLPYSPDEPQWVWHGTHRKMVSIRTKRIRTEDT